MFAMGFFQRLIDLITLRAERPIRRLLAYYVLLAAVVIGLAIAFPVVDKLLGGAPEEVLATPDLLEDALNAPDQQPVGPVAATTISRLETALETAVICLGTLVLMLPVSWVYMSAQNSRSHNQSVAQTLIILPLVVSGIILVVSNSLALAFSLAGVVSVLRFRTTLRDTRDVIYIFLGVAVGFAAGVHQLAIAAVLSIIFNIVVLLTWHYSFGRNALQPTASSVWSAPLAELAHSRNGHSVPDRDLVLALTPSEAENLVKRFNRVRGILGESKKPRYNAILTVTTNELTGAQEYVERALAKVTKRWKLDEVITNVGKPSIMFFLIKIPDATPNDEILTAVRNSAGSTIVDANIEVGNALAREESSKKADAKDELAKV
jgi:hypothetical protein